MCHDIYVIRMYMSNMYLYNAIFIYIYIHICNLYICVICTYIYICIWSLESNFQSQHQARDLLPHFCPAESICDFGAFLPSVLPQQKFLQLFSAGIRQRLNYESETTTRLVLDSLRRLPRSLRKSENLLSARCVVRGLSELHVKNLKMELVERLGGAVTWKTTPLHLHANPQALKSTPSSRISIMMNWKRITKVFRDIHQQARQKYASRMFLHWWLGF